MEPRTYLVAILFGLATGWGATLGREDRKAALLVLVASTLIGAATWVVDGDSIAGPSLTVGGGCSLITGAFFGWWKPQRQLRP
jgi:hypothetical protein